MQKGAVLMVLCALVVTAKAPAADVPIGSAFTYQGRLAENGAAANGTYEMRFTLFDASTSGTQIGTTTIPAVSVNNGVFNALLDFGSTPFRASARWLEIAVRPGGATSDFVVIAPRQQLTATPTSLYSLDSATIGGMRIVIGYVGTDCSRNSPGPWTSERIGSAQCRVTFDPPFSGAPIATVSGSNAGDDRSSVGRFVMIQLISAQFMDVHGYAPSGPYGGTGNASTPFLFIAIGPP